MSDDVLEELDLKVPGGARAETHTAYSRDLVSADLCAIPAEPKSVQPKSLIRVHSSHHALARCIATGMKPAQASLVTGYSAGRISALQNDPAFKALIEDYRREAQSWFADYGERIQGLGLDAIEILHERLQEKPEEFTVHTLLEVAKFVADRTGYAPGQNINLKVDASELIDRPPRETAEEWATRRAKELEEKRGLN